MDAPTSTDFLPSESIEPAQAVLAEVTCNWAEEPDALKSTTAVIVHAARDMLVLEAPDPSLVLPSVGTAMFVAGDGRQVYGRLPNTAGAADSWCPSAPARSAAIRGCVSAWPVRCAARRCPRR